MPPTSARNSGTRTRSPFLDARASTETGAATGRSSAPRSRSSTSAAEGPHAPRASTFTSRASRRVAPSLSTHQTLPPRIASAVTRSMKPSPDGSRGFAGEGGFALGGAGCAGANARAIESPPPPPPPRGAPPVRRARPRRRRWGRVARAHRSTRGRGPRRARGAHRDRARAARGSPRRPDELRSRRARSSPARAPSRSRITSRATMRLPGDEVAKSVTAETSTPAIAASPSRAKPANRSAAASTRTRMPHRW